MTSSTTAPGLVMWPDQAIALAGLRTDNGGIAVGPIAGEIDRQLDRRRT